MFFNERQLRWDVHGEAFQREREIRPSQFVGRMVGRLKKFGDYMSRRGDAPDILATATSVAREEMVPEAAAATLTNPGR